MKKLLKSNLKFFIGIIVGAIISGLSVYAITANNVAYNNTTVDQALNTLYTTQTTTVTNLTTQNSTLTTQNQTLTQQNSTLTSANETLTSEKNALQAQVTQLQNNGIYLNVDNLHLIKGTNRFSTTSGKKYLIVFNVTSLTSQSYTPSLVSGYTLLKETSIISASFNNYIYKTKAFIVEATGDEIVVNGSGDTNWNSIAYYEF